MTAIDVVIIVVAVVFVALVSARALWRGKKGITDCGCGCKNCPSAGVCSAKGQPSAKANTENTKHTKNTKEQTKEDARENARD